LALKDLTLNKIRNRVVTSATVLIAKHLGMTFFGSRETRISSPLIAKDLGKKRWPRVKAALYLRYRAQRSHRRDECVKRDSFHRQPKHVKRRAGEDRIDRIYRMNGQVLEFPFLYEIIKRLSSI
jgi:hypothetical protein